MKSVIISHYQLLRVGSFHLINNTFLLRFDSLPCETRYCHGRPLGSGQLKKNEHNSDQEGHSVVAPVISRLHRELRLLYPQTKVRDILDSGPSRRRRRRNFLVDAITQKQINIFFSNLVHMLRVPKGRSLF